MPLVNTVEDRAVLDVLVLALARADKETDNLDMRTLAINLLFTLLEMSLAERLKLAERLLSKSSGEAPEGYSSVVVHFNSDNQREAFLAAIRGIGSVTVHEAS